LSKNYENFYDISLYGLEILSKNSEKF